MSETIDLRVEGAAEISEALAAIEEVERKIEQTTSDAIGVMLDVVDLIKNGHTVLAVIKLENEIEKMRALVAAEKGKP